MKFDIVVAVLVVCTFCFQSLNGQEVAEENPEQLLLAIKAREKAKKMVDRVFTGRHGKRQIFKKKLSAADVLPKMAEGFQLSEIHSFLRSHRVYKKHDKLLWGEFKKYLKQSSSIPHLEHRFEDYDFLWRRLGK